MAKKKVNPAVDVVEIAKAPDIPVPVDHPRVQIRMKADHRDSADGERVETFKARHVYDVPKPLADRLIHNNWAQIEP